MPSEPALKSRHHDPEWSRTFDAGPEYEGYTRYRLGPSLRLVRYHDVGGALILLALPLSFIVIGLVLIGPPSLGEVGALTPFVIVIGIYGVGLAYFIRKAKTFSLPDAYKVDEYGIWVHRQDGTHEWLDWDDPRLYFVLLDRRPWNGAPHGTTELLRGNIPYLLPGEMFDLVLREAKQKGLAGPASTYRFAGGKVTRVIVSPSRARANGWY